MADGGIGEIALLSAAAGSETAGAAAAAGGIGIGLEAGAGSAALGLGTSSAFSLASLLPSSGMLSLASTGISIFGSIMQGQQSKGMYALEQQQYQESLMQSQVAAAQDEAIRTDRLNRTLSTQRALAGARGIDATGGSEQALETETTSQGMADIATGKLNALLRGRSALYGSTITGAEASLKEDQSIFGAGTSLATYLESLTKQRSEAN
jgi:hypothetical protein